MGAKFDRPQFDQRIHTRVDGFGNYLREHAERDLIPRIAQHQRMALNVAPDRFHFYQRVNTGRRCSCWASINTSASSNCIVCFGTGGTGGYEKFGHDTTSLDATASSASLNVAVDYSTDTKPLTLALVPGAIAGYVDFALPVLPNVGKCTVASVHARVPRGSALAAGIKLYSEVDFVPFSISTIEQRLSAATGQGGMVIRVALRRESASLDSPRLSLVRVRVQRLKSDIIRGDVPRSAQTNRGTEFGWIEDFATKTIYFDDTLRAMSTDDFVEDIATRRRWMFTSVNDNAPAGILTSWDVESRMIQLDERWSLVL